MAMKIERSVERAIIKWWQGLSVLSTCIHYWVDIIYERLDALQASESQPDHAARTIPEPRALIIQAILVDIEYWSLQCVDPFGRLGDVREVGRDNRIHRV